MIVLIYRIVLPDCRVVGGIKTVHLEQEVVEMIQEKVMVDADVASKFTRAIVDGREYYSQAYTRITKRNSYTVCYKEGETMRYGLIKYFLSLPNESVAIVNTLTPTSAYCYPQLLGILRSRIIPMKIESSINIIPVKSLVCKCVYDNS